jgi:hypothetical protein
MVKSIARESTKSEKKRDLYNLLRLLDAEKRQCLALKYKAAVTRRKSMICV